jgi:hypothetical protein
MKTSATASAAPLASPRATRTGDSSAARVAPPKAAERNPDSVTPTCTADRKRLGLAVSRATVWPRFPRCASCLTWLSRSETKDISAAAKIPPTVMNTKIRTM